MNSNENLELLKKKRDNIRKVLNEDANPSTIKKLNEKLRIINNEIAKLENPNENGGGKSRKSRKYRKSRKFKK